MSTTQLLNLMKIISWIIFIGLCIQAGAILISFLISIFSESGSANNLFMGIDLSHLKEVSTQYYAYNVSFLIAVPALKAYLFFLVIQNFTKLDLNSPFNAEIGNLISKISYYSFAIGIVALIGRRYSIWLLHRGMGNDIKLASSEFLFLGGILFIISLVFKRGLELQEENNLMI